MKNHGHGLTTFTFALQKLVIYVLGVFGAQEVQ